MDSISDVAIGLALGAGATVGRGVVSALVKDAYDKIKTLVMMRYPKVSVDQIEQAPESKSLRTAIKKDLNASGAGQDIELLVAAHILIELVQQHAPGTAAAIGVDLKDVEAANLRLAGIAASGEGVKVEKGKFSGDIDIRDVRAGVSLRDPAQNG